MAELWPGATPADLIDDLGHAIAERYRRIEQALYANLQRHLEQAITAPDDLIGRHKAIQDLRRQAEQLTQTVPPEALAKLATEQTAHAASAEIARMLLDFPAYQTGTITALTAGGGYAVAAVELDLRDQLRALNSRILRAPADAYQAMTSKHVVDMLAGTTTLQAQHRRILDEYLADGITGFIDRADRRWTIGAYSEMATRTAAARAWRDQSIYSMEATGITLFTPVVGVSACDSCAEWQGKTLSNSVTAGTAVTVAHAITNEPVTVMVDGTVAEWRGSGAGHPNCRCVLTMGLPGAPNPTDFSTHDPEKQRERETLRELEREVRQAKRDGDRTEIGEAQAAIRKFVDRTGIRRRSFREQLPFADGGSRNPRGRLVR